MLNFRIINTESIDFTNFLHSFSILLNLLLYSSVALAFDVLWFYFQHLVVVAAAAATFLHVSFC